MHDGLHPLAFLDQQLNHLATTIEGQMRAPTGLDSARPVLAFGTLPPVAPAGIADVPRSRAKAIETTEIGIIINSLRLMMCSFEPLN
jgi:hypothetical protein